MKARIEFEQPIRRGLRCLGGYHGARVSGPAQRAGRLPVYFDKRDRRLDKPYRNTVRCGLKKNPHGH
jgi:hypothetical protein